MEMSTRHLVDPEIAPLLEVFPSLDLTPDSLAEVRQTLEQMLTTPPEGTPDPVELYPDVTRTERMVPGAPGDPDVRILYYEPVGRVAPSPALVWIHGGGYVLGNADQEEATARRIATQAKTVVASVDYRLAPETRAPGQVEDCYAALRWLHVNADTLGVDPARVAIGGGSAGGGLTAALGLLARDRGEFPVCFQAPIYPMLDDRTATVREPNPYVGEFVWTRQANRFGWSAILGHEPGGDDTSPYVAAARADDLAGLPPTFLSVGSLDLFVEEDIAYAGRLIAAGVPTELHVYPGAFHAYDMVPGARLTEGFYRDFLGALTRAFTRPD